MCARKVSSRKCQKESHTAPIRRQDLAIASKRVVLRELTEKSEVT